MMMGDVFVCVCARWMVHIYALYLRVYYVQIFNAIFRGELLLWMRARKVVGIRFVAANKLPTFVLDEWICFKLNTNCDCDLVF